MIMIANQVRKSFALLVLAGCVLCFGSVVSGQQSAATSAANVEPSLDKTTQRYWKILTANPRPGAAFDNWYDGYDDRGELDTLTTQLQAATLAQPQSAQPQILLGLVLRRRGQWDEAVQAFAVASLAEPTSYYPHFLRGQTILQSPPANAPRLPEAVQACQASVTLANDSTSVPTSELFALYSQLGRSLQLAGDADGAVVAWEKLAALFPTDERVQTEVASWLQSERRWTESLAAWHRVESLRTDPQARLESRLAMADIHAQRNDRPSAIAILDTSLNHASPGSWLARSIRKRIEVLYRGDSDQLLSYLRQRLEKLPEELDTVLQLSHLLANDGDFADAIRCLTHAVERAPKRTDLRQALVELLRQAGQFSAAIEQSDELVRQNPHDIELLELAGQVRLASVDLGNRDLIADEVISAWKRIPAVRPQDPGLAINAGELCLRAAGIVNRVADRDKTTEARTVELLRSRFATSPYVKAAEEFFETALSLATDKSIYYEYLGKLFHDTGRPEQAIETLQTMVTGERSDGGRSDHERWSRLSQVYRGLGYREPALSAIQKSINLAPTVLAYRESCVDLLREIGDYPAAVSQLDGVISQLNDAHAVASTIRTRMELLTAGGLLESEIRRLQVSTQSGNVSWQELWMLGLAYETQGESMRAQKLFARATELLPDEPLLITRLAKVCVVNGEMDSAIDLFHRLAEMEPHLRSLHLGRIVDLHLRQNDLSAAGRTARELFAMQSSRSSDYLQRAAVAEKLNDPEMALRMLRKAVQSQPRDADSQMALAQFLVDHGQTVEAIDHYSQVVSLLDDLAAKKAIIGTMYRLDATQFTSQILPRLEREHAIYSELLFTPSRDTTSRDAKSRIATICLAEALLLVNDYSRAVECFHQVLRDNEYDIVVLRRLSDIALEANDTSVALRHLQRIAELTDDAEDWRRLMMIHATAGDDDASIQIAHRLVTMFGDVDVFSRLFDLTESDLPRAIRFAEIGLQTTPNDWRLSYRLALVTTNATDRSRLLQSTLDACFADPSMERAAQLRVQSNSCASLAQRKAASTRSIGSSDVWQGLNVGEGNSLHRDMPVFDELNAANAALQSPLARANGVLPATQEMPSDPFTTAIYCCQSLVALSGPESVDLDSMGHSSGMPDWVRQRVAAIHRAATGRIWASLDTFARYAELQPEDPLPHIVKFYEPIPGDSLDAMASILSALQTSFAWIQERDAELAARVSSNYAQQLIFAKQYDAAAELLAEQVDQADSLTGLAKLAPVCFQVEVPVFRERFLKRALQLSTAPDSIPEDLGDVLIVAFWEPTRRYNDFEWTAALALLTDYLKTPSHQSRSRSVTSPRKRQASESAPDQVLPRDNPYLSIYQREVIGRALAQSRHGEQQELLLAWFSRQATSSTASLTQRVAFPLVESLFDRKDQAADGFAKLSTEFPNDVDLRMLAAKSAYEADRLDDAFQLLTDKSLEGSRVESDMILLQSQVNSTISQLTDNDLALRCLVTALERQTVPYLYPFFASRVAPNAQDTLPTAGDESTERVKQNASSKDWLLSRSSYESAVVLRCLDHVWQLDHRAVEGNTGRLHRLETLVKNSRLLHSKNHELATIEMLLMLRNGDFASAQMTLTQWVSDGKQGHWSSATTGELASCLCGIDQPGIAEIGDQLAANYIVANIAGSAAKRGGHFLSRITLEIADQRVADESSRSVDFWRTFFDAVIRYGDGRSLADAEDIACESVKVLNQIPYDELPVAIRQMARVMNGPHADRFVPARIGPSLSASVRTANLHWSKAKRQDALDALAKLTFTVSLTAPSIDDRNSSN